LIYMQYCIPLKKSILIFFPECHTQHEESQEKASYVVQVMIRQV
jgi:hypothetical protein